MVRATWRRLAREDGVWSILAASAVAALLLAALAFSLDLAAATSARAMAQAALDSALITAAHQIAPSSIASASPVLGNAPPGRTLGEDVRRLVGKGMTIRVSRGPVVQGNRLFARIRVSIRLPAVLRRLRMYVQGEEAVGWLPQ